VLQQDSYNIGSARENTPTLLRIKQFVADNDRGLIHLDEIDKFSGGNLGTSGSSDSWSRFVVGEVFDLLDRTPALLRLRPFIPENAPEPEEGLEFGLDDQVL
jgi:hypothetical protein